MTGLAKLEEYKAPWEVDSDGAAIPEEDQKIDRGKLKRYLHNLLSDKARIQETVTSVTAERDTLKKDLDAKAREGENDEARKERERQEALKAAEAKGDLKALALDVALDVEGITAKQAKTLAKSLKGTTREELAEHASELVEEFGITKSQGEGDEEGKESEGTPVPTRPKVRRASGDPDAGASSLPDPSDAEALNRLFPRR